jgi:hypothetical protein
MKVRRCSGLKDEAGKFSIWIVHFSTLELAKFATLHPENKTYNPIEIFRVAIKVTNGKSSSIGLYEPVSPEEFSDKIIKSINFVPNITKSDDGDVFVTYTPSEDVMVIDEKLSTSPLTYYFNYMTADYHKTGSFYKLFDDVIRYGTFAFVDGTPLISGQMSSDNLYKKKIEVIKARRDMIRSNKAEIAINIKNHPVQPKGKKTKHSIISKKSIIKEDMFEKKDISTEE